MIKLVWLRAVNTTTIQVTFTGDLTEEQANKANFSLSKGEVENVSVSGEIATLTVTGLKYGEETTVTVVDPAHEATVTIPEVSELFLLDVEAEEDVITSDGATNTMITVALRDRLTGELIEEDGVVQFQATRGGLGQTTSALQNGKATVQLTSEASATTVESIITATIADVPGAKEYVGLTSQKTIVFSPDPQEEGKVEFVQPVFAESSQGDRFYVKFSDRISAADYKEVLTTTQIAKGDFMVHVNGELVKVKDVYNLTEDTLEFVLDVDDKGDFNRIEQTSSWQGTGNQLEDNNYLRDNVIHKVSFPDSVGDLVLENKDGVSFMLTDTSRPAVLGVTAKDQLEFSARFTETVDRRTVEDIAIPGTNDTTEGQKNFLLDGREVIVEDKPTPKQIVDAKANNEIILRDIKVGTYDFDEDGNAVDERNIVTFKVHKDFALAGGTHQLQVANVGDYAVDVDPTQNKVVTDTFDFDVTADDSVPAPEIEVQSPEQWKVSFDKEVYGTTNRTIEDVFSVKSADSDDEFKMGVDYIVSWIDEDGVEGGELERTKNADKLDGKQHFLIEFTKDWTQYYNTAANPTDTYFSSKKNPYTVTVENVESVIGNKIAKQELDVKLSYDGQSPEIDKAYQIEDTNKKLTEKVRVIMTEPVKNVDGNNEGLTPSQDQGKDEGVPVPTYEFVKGDKVVKAKAGEASYDDYAFTLTPEKTLEAGEWTLYIRSISDDIGNTSATVSHKVTIDAAQVEEIETETQVAWAAFDDSASSLSSKLLAEGSKHADKDLIYVKFTKEMKSSGSNGVSRTQNYVFMGQDLPTGSQVIKGIHGVTTEWDGVTIVMPKGTWDGTGANNNDFTTALNVASNFKSADGEPLSGGNEFELTDTDTETDDGQGASSLNDGVEALYVAKNSFANAVIGGAGLDADKNGKIDSVELFLDSENAGVDSETYVYVNGKKYDFEGFNNNNNIATFKGEEINGTTTNGLLITAADGSIIVNTGSVNDDANPVITKGELSSDYKEITLTFSEAVTGSDKGIFEALEKEDFTFPNNPNTTVTAVDHDPDTPNKVVLTVSGGDVLEHRVTVTHSTLTLF